MTVRELYKLLQDRLPPERRDLNLLAWPLYQPTLGVQYIDSGGNRIPPIVDNPASFEFPEPLGGPFYGLEVKGIAPALPLGKWKQLRAVVANGDELTLSAVIQLRLKVGDLKGLASDLGIQWYHVNFDWPWKFTPVPNLDDCVKYERETNESRV